MAIDFKYNIDDSNIKYEQYWKLKNSGGRRLISIPSPKLKNIQKRILNSYLYSYFKPSDYAHGNVIGRSNKTAGEKHIGWEFYIHTDIKNFFNTVSREHLRNILIMKSIPHIDYILQHTFIPAEGYISPNKLPQGAPTSPCIANIILFDFDNFIGNIVKEIDPSGVYTRYVDDINISYKNQDNIRNKFGILAVIREVLYNKYRLELNDKKTYYKFKGSRGSMLGLSISKNMINITKEKRRSFRAKLHNIYMDLKNDKKVEFNIEKLDGFISYALNINTLYGNKWRKKLDKICNIIKEHNGGKIPKRYHPSSRILK